MIRNLLLSILFCLILTSCNHSNKTGDLATIPADSTSTTLLSGRVLDLNTFTLHGNHCKIDSITKAEFETIKVEPVPDTSETKRLLDDAEHVVETSMGLKFKLNNGDTFLLKNVVSYPDSTDSTMLGEDYVKYDFEKNYTGTNYWGVDGQFYEGGSYFLVDKRSGKINGTLGLPVLSPNKKLFISSYYDMSEESPSGIGLYRDGNDSLETIFAEEPGWTMGEIKWKDDNTIYFIQVWYDTVMQAKSRYAKLDLGQLHLPK